MPGRRLAKQAAHHRPLLPDQPRKPAGVGRGAVDSGSSSPIPPRQQEGREVGRQAPTIPTAMGPDSHSPLPSIGRG